MRSMYIPVISRTLSTKVDISTITMLKNDKRELIISTMEGDKYRMYGGLENVESYLDERFYPCTKGTYLNITKIAKMDSDTHGIVFENGDKHFLGRDSFIKTRQVYNAYLRTLKGVGDGPDRISG